VDAAHYLKVSFIK